MKNKKNKLPEDGFPDVKTGIQKWEILTIAISILAITIVAYLICDM